MSPPSIHSSAAILSRTAVPPARTPSDVAVVPPVLNTEVNVTPVAAVIVSVDAELLHRTMADPIVNAVVALAGIVHVRAVVLFT